MNHPRAGQLAQPEDLVDVTALVDAYYDRMPDATNPDERVVFGTSGHRGSSLRPRSTRRTSSPRPRRSASTARRRASTARCSSGATPTRCPSRPGSPRSRSWSPTASRCSSTRATATPRRRPCRTRSSRSTAARPVRLGRRAGRRDRRHAVAQPAAPTAGSSTTRPMADRPTPTRRRSSRPGPTSCIRDGLRGVRRVPLDQALARDRDLRLHRSLRRRPAQRRRPRGDQEAGVRIGADPLGGASSRTGARSASGTASTSPSSTPRSTRRGGS